MKLIECFKKDCTKWTKRKKESNLFNWTVRKITELNEQNFSNSQ